MLRLRFSRHSRQKVSLVDRPGLPAITSGSGISLPLTFPREELPFGAACEILLKADLLTCFAIHFYSPPRSRPSAGWKIGAVLVPQLRVEMVEKTAHKVKTMQNRKSMILKGGSSSVVERQLPKLNVAGSIPVSRSIKSTTYEEARNLCSIPTPLIFRSALTY